MGEQGHLCPVLFPSQAEVRVLSVKQDVIPTIILGGSISPALDFSEVPLQIPILSLLSASQWLSPAPCAGGLHGAGCLLFWQGKGVFRVLNAPHNIAGL